MVYVGDRNAFDEIVEDNQKLKNEIVYSKVEIDRLNNIINELEKMLYVKYDEWKDSANDIIRESAYEDLRILEYLTELKENNK